MHFDILKVRVSLFQIVNAFFILHYIFSQLNNLVKESLFLALGGTGLVWALRLTWRIQLPFRESFSKFPLFRSNLILVSSILWIDTRSDVSLNPAHHSRTKIFKLLKDYFLSLWSILSHKNTFSVDFLSLGEIPLIFFIVKSIWYIEVWFHLTNTSCLHVIINTLGISDHTCILHPYDQIISQLTHTLILNKSRVFSDGLQFFKHGTWWWLPRGNFTLDDFDLPIRISIDPFTYLQAAINSLFNTALISCVSFLSLCNS